ncbi:hypothetical protein O6H91_14G066900 [Diphasiastrum complanatum]|uniref:Uncharacterized protein n=1 Tax=Diphasiastrum complanatum TaxID=34168 RepID=A0ACC2BQ89_DIPCM|nr:hypothetical protein O6H91_14G066900 [Diphasiastrum complanatum]
MSKLRHKANSTKTVSREMHKREECGPSLYHLEKLFIIIHVHSGFWTLLQVSKILPQSHSSKFKTRTIFLDFSQNHCNNFESTREAQEANNQNDAIPEWYRNATI